jgi:hypothetical protein
MRLVLALAAGCALSGAAQADRYQAAPEIINPGAGGETIRGVVFEDANRDGVRSRGEAGVPGVLVSNGRDWTRTGADGAYEIAVRADMDLTIVQPAGWRVPTDHRLVPQFFYIHKPGGTGYELRYGGLPDTGPAPEAVNFPLIRDGAAGEAFTCAIIGDSQVYSNEQISWFRDSVGHDLSQAGLTQSDCVLYVGDVMGDDLGLLDRLLEVGAMAGAPQWLTIGNHDYDFDARSNADKGDSWRRIFGPTYYAFEQGDVLFVVLDNVDYPCQTGRSWCGDPERPAYNGIVDETQMMWLEGLIEATPEDRLIVLAHHIPFVSFVDSTSDRHQTDNAGVIHALLEGREALSLSGHTHTTENHAPGQIFEGWAEQAGVGPLPFRHIIAGAASGAWYQGDFNVDGVPMSLQRMGAPMGYLRLDFEGPAYVERYIGARIDQDRGQWVGLSTPDFRDWFEAIYAWVNEPASGRDPVPPFSINDLPDTRILTPQDFDGGVWLTANVWAGSAETSVSARLPDGSELALERTQEGAGEAARIGAEWADPFSTQRQLSVSRIALQSRSGNERAQGAELFRGSNFGPAAPQPQRSIADRNMHMWRVALPRLPDGVHRIEVTSTDRNGVAFTDTLLVEVRAERPARYWRREFWQ